MYCDLWPYVWLINESGFKSRAAYGGARTVFQISQDKFCFGKRVISLIFDTFTTRYNDSDIKLNFLAIFILINTLFENIF